MINIFVALSNTHIQSFETLIKNHLIKGEKLLITSSYLTFDKKLWDRILKVNNSFNNQSGNLKESFKNIIVKIRVYKSILKQIENFKKTKDIYIYYTYVEDILTNYLLFSFNKNIKGIAVEDGALNYYSHTIFDLDLKKLYMKWLISNLMGLRFKFYKGHSSGIEYKRVEKQFVKAPELSVFNKKSIQLPFVFKKPILTDSILIIGQEAYINMYGLKRYMNSLDYLIKIIKGTKYYQKIETVFYKPHRHGARINYNVLEDGFKSKTFIILDSEKPIEDIFFHLNASKYIFSFDSSSLINIYLESHNDVRNRIQINVLSEYNLKLEPLFRNFNFNIYKIDHSL